MLASRAMDAAPRSALLPGRRAEAALLVALGVLLAAAIFDGGGSRVDSLASVGIASLVVAGIALAAALRGHLPLPRLERGAAAAVVGAVALTAWAGLSVAWSIAGDRSWDWLGRGLVYLAFLVLGLLAGAMVSGARRFAFVLTLVVGAAIGWALLGVAIPSLFPDGDRIARLREPVGYWNALALLADGALALGLWLASEQRPGFRVVGALLSYAGVLAVLLTQSRAGVVGAVAVVVLWLVASRERSADALRVVLSVVPALAVGGWAFTRPALVEDGVLRADRVSDGRLFAVPYYAGARAVIYRTDQYRAAGIRSTPKTLAEFNAAGLKLMKRYGGKKDATYSAVYFPGRYWYAAMSFVYDWGGQIATFRNGRWQGALNSGKALAGLTAWRNTARTLSKANKTGNEAQPQQAEFLRRGQRGGVHHPVEGGGVGPVAGEGSCCVAGRARRRGVFSSAIGRLRQGARPPRQGEAAAAEIVKEAVRTGKRIPDLLREKKLLPEEKIAEIFTPEFLAGQADRD